VGLGALGGLFVVRKEVCVGVDGSVMVDSVMLL
jgi:hypothetical protein